MNPLYKLKTLIDKYRNSELSREAAVGILEAAVEVLESGDALPEKELLHEFLNITSSNGYVKSLEDKELQLRWAETAFRAVQVSGYSLRDMFEERVSRDPQKILFRDMSVAGPISWSYGQIARHIREIAALFINYTHNEPRVAIFSDNSVESASCDLACLFYEILVTPLNTQFNRDVLHDIFTRLNINIAVTDTEDRLNILEEIRDSLGLDFHIFVTDKNVPIKHRKTSFLGESCKRLNSQIIDSALEKRKRLEIDQVCTVMFTSGSTGSAKGVSFSNYNLVSKRFARAAAMPGVGDNEVLLSYLPLYHTFGRYYEMLGMIYWHGTYVFAGNPSAETLFSLMPVIEPTGFVSVPLRWLQLYEKCMESTESLRDAKAVQDEIRKITGGKLRWGISAAGFLDSKVFRFFQRNGIALCSGFGMTEATGGITMTPPGKYIDNTTGIPLPGINTKLSPEGELLISGHYVGRYLVDKAPGDVIPFPVSPEKDYWMSTGDVFRVLPNGYYEIIDRIKDIYKNNRGQTIAPKAVEDKFTGVPAIKSVFLVGDGKAYNVLLIVPDANDPLYKSLKAKEEIRDYYHRIIDAVNIDLAPYERVVNFEILARDFSREKGELTAKASYNRKIIEGNFSGIIEELYRQNYVMLKSGDLSIKIPLWFYRDFGMLEDDIYSDGYNLINRLRNTQLTIQKITGNSYRIGDLVYQVNGSTLDLGAFALHPGLWCGNPELTKFSPCKEGWDIAMSNCSLYASFPQEDRKAYTEDNLPILPYIKDRDLFEINILVSVAFFDRKQEALKSLEKLGAMLTQTDDRKAKLIRMRLSALSQHPDEEIRCKAYRILLLDEPGEDDDIIFPPFIYSGLSFLTKKSIEKIAGSKMEKRRLDALRRRLYSYRKNLDWSRDGLISHQLEHIFQILLKFAASNPDFTRAVRAELARWILLKESPEVSESAEKYFYDLLRMYKNKYSPREDMLTREIWDRTVIFEADINEAERETLRKVLLDTAFLKYSVELSYDERGFRFPLLADKGIWISRIFFPDEFGHYRISINLSNGKHYDIHMMINQAAGKQAILDISYRYIAYRSFPVGTPVLPPLGWFSTKRGAISFLYNSSMTVWEKIRSYAVMQSSETGTAADIPKMWRKMYIQAFTAYLRLWNNSGKTIVPMPVSTSNVMVPELDYLEGAMLVSMTGFSAYSNTLSLVKPIVESFYTRTVAHYPNCGASMDVTWLFESCLEGLGEAEGKKFLYQLYEDLKKEEINDHQSAPVSDSLKDFLNTGAADKYIHLAVHNAIESYGNWSEINNDATPWAREQAVLEVFRLYRLERFPEIMRYYLYRNTYFNNSGENITQAFDWLLDRMFIEKGRPAIQFIELSDLQSTINSNEDRNVFSRLVFPRKKRSVEFLKLSDRSRKKLLVQSLITDKSGITYTFRTPLKASEIGELYRMFYKERYPLQIGESDKYYVLADEAGRIAGGLCYRYAEHKSVYLEGAVITSSLQRRGLGRAMIDEFCLHVANQGVEAAKTHFFLPGFLMSAGFKTDSRKGALVRKL